MVLQPVKHLLAVGQEVADLLPRLLAEEQLCLLEGIVHAIGLVNQLLPCIADRAGVLEL